MNEEKFFVYDDLDRMMSNHFDRMSKYTFSKRLLRLVYLNHLNQGVPTGSGESMYMGTRIVPVAIGDESPPPLFVPDI